MRFLWGYAMASYYRPFACCVECLFYFFAIAFDAF